MGGVEQFKAGRQQRQRRPRHLDPHLRRAIRDRVDPMKGGDAGGTSPAADGGNAVEQRCIRTTVRQPVAADMAKRDGSTADRVEHCIARFGREAERPAQLRSSRHAFPSPQAQKL